jgi:DNA-binding SARP family transcriptional activator
MVASAPFEVTLFGLPQLAAAGRTIHVGSRKALALVAWLAQEGESPRERLAQQLWADLDLPAARRNLRREVFRLRQAGLSIAASANAGLSLAADVVVDLKRFHAALASGDDEGALSISRGTLLDGLEGVAGAEFDSWLQRCRTQAAQQRLQARARHAKVLEQRGEHTAALALHLQAVVEDRCHEGAACAAMRLLAHSSDRAAALAQYNQLVAALRDELGIEPGAATQALAAELRGNGVDSATPVAEPLAAASVSPALLAPKLPFVERAALQAQVEAAWQAGRWVYLLPAPAKRAWPANALPLAARGCWSPARPMTWSCRSRRWCACCVRCASRHRIAPGPTGCGASWRS